MPFERYALRAVSLILFISSKQPGADFAFFQEQQEGFFLSLYLIFNTLVGERFFSKTGVLFFSEDFMICQG